MTASAAAFTSYATRRISTSMGPPCTELITAYVHIRQERYHGLVALMLADTM